MFSLRHHDSEAISYGALYNETASDAQIEASMDAIVEALFSICVSLGRVPIIRCPKGLAAEMIATRLDMKIRAHLRNSRGSLFTESMSAHGSFQRPLLAIVDRNVDLATTLHHAWSYQALVHDLLDLELNRVENLSDPKTPSFDLSKRDKFWNRFRGAPFHEVLGAPNEELEALQKRESDILSLQEVRAVQARFSLPLVVLIFFSPLR